MKTDVSTKRTLLHVPLARLKFGHERPGSGINARAPNGGQDIDRLAASLERLGVVIPLVVQESPSGHDQGVYVADGNRRLEALRRIVTNETRLKISPLDLNAIPCVVGVGDGLELSLVANIDRLPLHPVDKCEAFAILVDQGAEIADVAARFSIRPREVEQALAIRALAPEIRAAWRAGEIKADVAQAFTIEPDQKRQAKVFAALKKAGNLWDAEIRSQLVGHREDHSKYLAFVGVESYEAAGGRVMRDLFRERHAVSDTTLLKKMVDAAMTAAGETLVAGGWAWALPHDSPAVRDKYIWKRIGPDAKPTKDEKARLKEMQAHLDKIDERDDNDDDDERDALADEMGALEQAIALRAFVPEEKKRSGCILRLNDEGTLDVDPGYLMPSAKAEKVAAKASGEAPSPADKKKAEAARYRKATAGEVSKALDERLTVALRKATQQALKIVAAAFDRASPTIGRLGMLLASLAADLMRPEERWHRPIPDKIEQAIREAIKPEIMVEQLRKAFDAKDYFASVPKANMLAIVREIEGLGLAFPGVDKMKTAALAKWCAANVPERGWLPRQLRGPWYDAKPKAKKRR